MCHKAATAKSVITENNAQMLNIYGDDIKTWTSEELETRT
jgi:hypothetical protein